MATDDMDWVLRLHAQLDAASAEQSAASLRNLLASATGEVGLNVNARIPEYGGAIPGDPTDVAKGLAQELGRTFAKFTGDLDRAATRLGELLGAERNQRLKSTSAHLEAGLQQRLGSAYLQAPLELDRQARRFATFTAQQSAISQLYSLDQNQNPRTAEDYYRSRAYTSSVTQVQQQRAQEQFANSQVVQGLAVDLRTISKSAKELDSVVADYSRRGAPLPQEVVGGTPQRLLEESRQRVASAEAEATRRERIRQENESLRTARESGQTTGLAQLGLFGPEALAEERARQQTVRGGIRTAAEAANANSILVQTTRANAASGAKAGKELDDLADLFHRGQITLSPSLRADIGPDRLQASRGRVSRAELDELRRDNARDIRDVKERGEASAYRGFGADPLAVAESRATQQTERTLANLLGRRGLELSPEASIEIAHRDARNKTQRQLAPFFDDLHAGTLTDPARIAEITRLHPEGLEEARKRAEAAEERARKADESRANAEQTRARRGVQESGVQSGLFGILGSGGLNQLQLLQAFHGQERLSDKFGARELVGELSPDLRQLAAVVAEQNAQSSSISKSALAAARGQLPDHLAALIPQDERARADIQVGREGRTARQRELEDIAHKELGALDETVAEATTLLKLEERRRQLYGQLAEAVAQQPDRFGAGSAERQALERHDPQLLRDAEIKAQDQRYQRYLRSNAPAGEKLGTLFTRTPPGEQPIPGRGFSLGGVLEGFTGSEGRLDHAAGQALKFSVLYGGLYAAQSLVTKGFAQAASGAADYEEALTALALATGKSVESNEELAASASRLGSEMGFGAAAGVQTAARAVGLYDLNNPDLSDTERRQISTLSTAVSGRISRVSGTPIDQVQGDVAGLIRSFGLSAYDQPHIEDTLVTVAQQSGQNTADLLSAATQIGTFAKEAGFSVEQAFALISTVATTTSQTPDAVAGQITQILSKANDPATLAKLQAVGVNVQGTNLRQQLEQAAGLNLDPATQQQLVNQFGHGRAGQALQVILQNNDRIQALGAAAAATPEGRGEQAFNQVMGDLRNQLAVLGAKIQEILNELAKAGLFEGVKLVVAGLTAMAQIVERVTSAYGAIPEPIRDAIAGFLALTATMKILDIVMRVRAAGGVGEIAGDLLSKQRGRGGSLLTDVADVAGGVLGKGGGTRVAAEAARDAAQVGAVAAEVAAPAAAGGVLARIVGGGAGFTGAVTSRAAGALAGPIGGLIVGGLTLFDQYETALRDREHTSADFLEANRAAAIAATPDALREAADKFVAAQKSAAAQQEISFSNLLKNGVGVFAAREQGSSAEGIEHRSIAQADDLRKRADELEKAQAEAEAANPLAAFQNFGSADAVSNALDLMAKKGYDATESFNALNKALDDLIYITSGSPNAIGVIQKGQGTQFATQAGAATTQAINQTLTDLQKQPANPLATQRVVDQFTGGDSFGNAIRAAQEIDTTPKFQAPWLDPQAPNAYRPSWLTGMTPGQAAGARAADRANDMKVLSDALKNAPALSKGAQEQVTAYLRAIGKDPANGVQFLTEQDVGGLKDTLIGYTKANLPGLSAEGARATADNFLSNFGSDTSGFLNVKPSLQAVQAGLPAALQGAKASADLAGVLARDSTTANRQYLANLRDEEARFSKIADAIPDPQQRADARHLIRNQVLGQTIQATDATVADYQTQLGRWSAEANSFYAPDQTSERAANQIKIYDELLKLPTRTGDQIAKMKDALTQQPLTPAQKAALEDEIAKPSLTPDKKAELEVQRREAQQAKDASDRQAQRQTELAGMYFDSHGKYVGATQQDLLRIQLRQAKDEVGRTANFLDTNSAKGAALQNFAQLSQQQAQVDLQNRATNRGLAVKPGFQLDAQRIALANAKDALAHAKELGQDRNQLQLQVNQLSYDVAMGQLRFAQSIVKTDTTNPLMAAKKELDDLLAQQAAEPNAEARRAYDPKIAAARGKQLLAGFQEQAKAIDDSEALDRITGGAAIAARKREIDQVKAQIARMKDDDDYKYALQQFEIDLEKGLKSAQESYSGQFNLRDIKLPTVYEIRRSLGGGLSEISGGSSTVNHVEINGADFARVVAYLQGIFGKQVASTRSTGARRVG